MRKVIILESDEEFLSELKAAFSQSGEFDVCGAVSSGSAGVALVSQFKPDVLILDTVLSGEDGFGVMKRVKAEGVHCEMFVISRFCDDDLVAKAIRSGAKYYFVKPVTAGNVCARVQEVLEETAGEYLAAKAQDRRRVTSLDEKISNIFITIGVPPHIMGYKYLREAVKLTVENPQVVNEITKVLYPTVAEKFESTPSKVERAIRHAIEVAWNRGRVEAINSLFGVKVYLGNDKPTNSEFIALIADKLICDTFT